VLSSTNPGDKLREMAGSRDELIEKKENIIKELNPDAFTEELIRISSTIVWAKPRRKDYQSKSYFHIIEGVMKEIRNRLSLSRKQVLSAPLKLIEKALVTGKIDYHVLNSLFDSHVTLPEGSKFVILSGKMAEEFSKTVIRKKEQFNDAVDELKGDTACPGKTKGVVKIVNLPGDMDKMKRGDILVSSATTPNIVSAMRKAAAIVTDEGGLTCHASIVSRELGTPCIVGTKVVTKAFKDGDLVEVDATKGIIRRIEAVK